MGVNIKDYLIINEQENKLRKKSSGGIRSYTFEKIFDNGSDFIIKRISSTGIERQLCFIADKNLLFIRIPKEGRDKQVTGVGEITSFLQLGDLEFREMEFKNEFFNCRSTSSFAERMYSLHTRRPLERELVKYNLNPNDFFEGYCGSAIEYLSNVQFDLVLKVLRLLQKYPSVIQKKQINGNVIATLVYLAKTKSIDYVTIFLDELNKSDINLYFNLTWKNNSDRYVFDPLFKLLKDFNFDFRILCHYLLNDLYFQGIATLDGSIIGIYYDCLKLQQTIYDGKIKEKYPQHLKECHDKATLIFNLNAEFFTQKAVEKFKTECLEYEYTGKKYSIILAQDSGALIEEGINLHHCVGSYVERVKRGECAIFFLRENSALDTSLITIEVKEKSIVQVRGLCERLMTDEERLFVKEWCNIKKLNFERE